jgi:hypothetical protein
MRREHNFCESSSEKAYLALGVRPRKWVCTQQKEDKSYLHENHLENEMMSSSEDEKDAL